MHNTIKSYVKKKPVVIREVDYKKLSSNDIDKLFKKFKNSKIDLIPVINEKKVIHLIDSEAKKTQLNKIPLVLMAGGKGVRLKPFTDIFPKPLIPVNNIPAAEQIVNSFRENGVNKIFLVLTSKRI